MKFVKDVYEYASYIVKQSTKKHSCETPKILPPDPAHLKKPDPDPTLIRNEKKVLGRHKI